MFPFLFADEGSHMWLICALLQQVQSPDVCCKLAPAASPAVCHLSCQAGRQMGEIVSLKYVFSFLGQPYVADLCPLASGAVTLMFAT